MKIKIKFEVYDNEDYWNDNAKPIYEEIRTYKSNSWRSWAWVDKRMNTLMNKHNAVYGRYTNLGRAGD